MVTVQQATAVVREYFHGQCVHIQGGRLFSFRVNHALDQGEQVTIWCTHACFAEEHHHRVAVEAKNGRIVAVQKLANASDLGAGGV